MLLLAVLPLSLVTSLCYSTPILGAPGHIDLPPTNNTKLPAGLEWETVTLPDADAIDPARYVIACAPRYGVGLYSRSCFNALDLAPRGGLQELWVDQGRAQPGLPGVVYLPMATLSGKSYSRRPDSGLSWEGRKHTITYWPILVTELMSWDPR